MRSARYLLGLACILLAGCAPAGAAAVQRSDTVSTAQVDLPPSYVFMPQHIQIASGTTVTWTNHDNFTHSVQVERLGTEVHMLKPGEATQLTFSAPGDYPYVCTLHAQTMRGTVSVS
jgi:plastocyanin